VGGVNGHPDSCCLTADEEAILRQLATGPHRVGDVLSAVNPFPWRGSGDDYERMREIRAWHRRDGELRLAEARLRERGLIEGPANGRRITGAGREELARANAEGGDAP
jgi:hypothetical protein